MRVGARIRRTVPYLAIALSGFALAYVVVFFFILPANPSGSEVLATPKDTTDTLLPVIAPPKPAAPPETLVPTQSDVDSQAAADTAVTIPNLMGADATDAQSRLDQLHIVTVIRQDTNSFDIPNTVLRQAPVPGQRMMPGDTVVLTVSKFPQD